MSAAAQVEEVLLSPTVARSLPLVAARLSERHPELPVEVVIDHVQAAAAVLSREARIQDFLPILIERMASASLERHPD